MYRVIAIVSGGLALAACASTNLDTTNSAAVMETVRFESQPPGAEAKASNGQTCRTPCALALPASGAYTITFTLNGYQPETDQIELVSMGDNTSQLRPNPVLVELTPAAPPSKPGKKKPARKKNLAAKPAAKPAAGPKPAAARAAAPAATTSAPAQQQAPSPWPATPTR